MNSMWKMILTVLITGLVVGSGTYYLAGNKKSPQQTNTNTSTTSTAYKTFSGQEGYGLKFSYPPTGNLYSVTSMKGAGETASSDFFAPGFGYRAAAGTSPTIEVSFLRAKDFTPSLEGKSFLEAASAMVTQVCNKWGGQSKLVDSSAKCTGPSKSTPFTSDSGVSGYKLDFTVDLHDQWPWSVYIFNVGTYTANKETALMVAYNLQDGLDVSADYVAQVAKSISFQK